MRIKWSGRSRTRSGTPAALTDGEYGFARMKISEFAQIHEIEKCLGVAHRDEGGGGTVREKSGCR